MGKGTPLDLIPAKQLYHNILSKNKFKAILEYCLDVSNTDDANVKLVEQLFLGALAAVELDLNADIHNKDLDVEQTKAHYREYVEIAKKVLAKSGSSREDLQAFISRMDKYCLPSEQVSFFTE